MSNDKLIDKIKKLLAKAAGTDVQAEADAFIAAANRLLLKHNLSMTEVEAGGSENAIKQDANAKEWGEVAAEGIYEAGLMHYIAVNNFCKVIIHAQRGGKRGTLSVIGSPENIEITLYMFEVARTSLRRISKKAYTAYKKTVIEKYPLHSGETRPQREKCLLSSGVLRYRKVWIRSYLKGAAIGLGIKLENERRRAQDENPQQFALVLSRNTEALDLFAKKTYPDLGKTRNPNLNNADRNAFKQGLKAGKGLNINEGVAEAKQNELKRLGNG